MMRKLLVLFKFSRMGNIALLGCLTFGHLTAVSANPLAALPPDKASCAGIVAAAAGATTPGKADNNSPQSKPNLSSVKQIVERLRANGGQIVKELLQSDNADYDIAREEVHSTFLAEQLENGLRKYLDKIHADLESSSEPNKTEVFAIRKRAYDFIVNKLEAAKKNRAVSLYFYNAAAEFLIRGYMAVVEKGVEWEVSAENIFNRGIEKQTERAGADLRKNHITMYIFASLNMYDILEFWPEILPREVRFEEKNDFDDKKDKTSLEFASHDGQHAGIFLEEFYKLTQEQRRQFVAGIKYLRAIRQGLSQREEIIVGEYFGYLIHEGYELKLFIDLLFSEQSIVELLDQSLKAFKDLALPLRLQKQGLISAEIRTLQALEEEALEVLTKVVVGFRKQ